MTYSPDHNTESPQPYDGDYWWVGYAAYIGVPCLTMIGIIFIVRWLLAVL